MYTLLLLTTLCSTPEPPQTPAELQILRARRQIEARPEDARPYNQLALGLARRARETANPDFYDQAEGALEKALELRPENFESRKLEVWLDLGRHRFAEALVAARELNREVPDDLQVYGFVVDAAVETGRYEEAEQAAQWMLDLRPGNIPGLTRAAYLRELFGDVDGALELMRMAYTSTPLTEVEDRAWIVSQMAHLHRSVGRVESAASLCELALELFPDYHYALHEFAKVKAALGERDEELALLRRHYEVAPHPENLYHVGVALHEKGELEEASDLFARFEESALSESESPDNANLDLVDYYLRFAPDEDGPVEALRIARLELSRRKDVRTRAAYAWALHANGRSVEALRELDDALELGVQDAELEYRRGEIALACGQEERATEHLRKSLALEPRGPRAPRAAVLLSGRR